MSCSHRFAQMSSPKKINKKKQNDLLINRKINATDIYHSYIFNMQKGTYPNDKRAEHKLLQMGKKNLAFHLDRCP